MTCLSPHTARRCGALVLALAFAAMLPAAHAPVAGAKSVRAKITSPRHNATVTPTFHVRVRVRAATGKFRIRYYIDGRLVRTTWGGRTRRTIRRATLVSPGPGRHRVRALVTSRGHRASSSVKIRALEPGNSLPNPPPAKENFRMIFNEDFSVPAASGTMGSDYDADKVIYTGTNGTKWLTYPRSFVDTYDKRPYRSDQVLSVHDGYLDYHLHQVDGRPAGANPSPLVTGSSQYQTYGRYSARMRVDDTDMSEYYIAWLLWPADQNAWASAESDFPEGSLKPGNTGVFAFHHWASGQTEWFSDPAIDVHDWHTYTQDWTPTERRYWVDDKLIGVTKKPVFKGPERWQLQIETKGSGSHSGHVLVDWAAVWAL